MTCLPKFFPLGVRWRQQGSSGMDEAEARWTARYLEINLQEVKRQ